MAEITVCHRRGTDEIFLELTRCRSWDEAEQWLLSHDPSATPRAQTSSSLDAVVTRTYLTDCGDVYRLQGERD